MKFEPKIKNGEESLVYEIDTKTRGFFCEERNQREIETRLIKHNLEFKNDGRAVFSKIGDLVHFTSFSTKEEITFALEDCIKLLRPYPEGK